MSLSNQPRARGSRSNQTRARRSAVTRLQAAQRQSIFDLNRPCALTRQRAAELSHGRGILHCRLLGLREQRYRTACNERRRLQRMLGGDKARGYTVPPELARDLMPCGTCDEVVCDKAIEAFTTWLQLEADTAEVPFLFTDQTTVSLIPEIAECLRHMAKTQKVWPLMKPYYQAFRDFDVSACAEVHLQEIRDSWTDREWNDLADISSRENFLDCTLTLLRDWVVTGAGPPLEHAAWCEFQAQCLDESSPTWRHRVAEEVKCLSRSMGLWPLPKPFCDRVVQGWFEAQSGDQ